MTGEWDDLDDCLARLAPCPATRRGFSWVLFKMIFYFMFKRILGFWRSTEPTWLEYCERACLKMSQCFFLGITKHHLLVAPSSGQWIWGFQACTQAATPASPPTLPRWCTFRWRKMWVAPDRNGGIAWNCRIACSVSFVRSTCLQLKWSLQMSSSKSAMSFEKNRGAGLGTAHHHLLREGCKKRKEKDGWLLLHLSESLRQGHPKSTKSICLKYFMNFYWFIQQKFGENHGRSHHPAPHHGSGHRCREPLCRPAVSWLRKGVLIGTSSFKKWGLIIPNKKLPKKEHIVHHSRNMFKAPRKNPVPQEMLFRGSRWKAHRRLRWRRWQRTKELKKVDGFWYSWTIRIIFFHDQNHF